METPSFQGLWTALSHEESRLMSRERIQRYQEEEEYQAYAAQFKNIGGRDNFSFQ